MSLNDENRKDQKISFRWKLGWHPNDEKPQEARMNIDKPQDGMLMMRNERNIDKAWIEPRKASQ